MKDYKVPQLDYSRADKILDALKEWNTNHLDGFLDFMDRDTCNIILAFYACAASIIGSLLKTGQATMTVLHRT